MKAYLDLVQHVLDNGTLKKNRTGTDTLMSFGYHYKVDLSKGFPLLTTKKVFFNSVIRVVMVFIWRNSHRNLRDTKIWTRTSEEKLGSSKMYGYQWVNWENLLKTQNRKIRKRTYKSN